MGVLNIFAKIKDANSICQTFGDALTTKRTKMVFLNNKENKQYIYFQNIQLNIFRNIQALYFQNIQLNIFRNIQAL